MNDTQGRKRRPDGTFEPAATQLGEIVPNASTASVDPQKPQQAPKPRRPFGINENKFDFPERPGFHNHIFNDLPGRVERAKEAGYAHVLDKEGKPVKLIVDKGSDGRGMNGYLMEIPREWYEEDMALVQRESDKVDQAILRGRRPARNDSELQGAEAEASADHSYIPKSGIRIAAGRRPL
jgi:hypothetical protein